MTEGWGSWFTRRWRWWILAIWIAACALMLYDRWAAIRWFALSDTDDNMRMMQVRALLGGQDWFDLRQYRMNPPDGIDMHWTRLVDLPIAGLKLAAQPFLGGADAERFAAALAPMLPLLVAMTALAAAARRLVAPGAWALAAALLLSAASARSMFAPLRIDHHNWQLAMLAVAVAALVDPKRARGGAILGAASAVSITIGLEMLAYLAVAGGAIVLMWVRDPAEARRMATYGAALAGGTALGYLLFASRDNRLPLCDALTPVWLSAMAAAGALALALALLSPRSWPARLGAAAACGALLAAALAGAWPHCLGRLEQVGPEATELWLSRVREALPIHRHPWRTWLPMVALPVVGLAGYAAMLWRARRHPERLIPWAAAAALGLLAAALLLWQTRAAPHAQLLAVPGAAGLAWLLFGLVRGRHMAIAAAGIVAAFLLVSGLAVHHVVRLFPADPGAGVQAVRQASRRCPTLPALAPVGRHEPGLVLTFVDLGPRLITVTRHAAITGPYHRNDRQIVDVMRAWRGDADNALATVRRYGVDYVLICPGMAESTIYRAEARDGFYAQLARGAVPSWLEPIELPENSPYRMWRVTDLARPRSRR